MASTTFIVGDQPSEVNGGSTPLQVQVTITEVADLEGGSGTDLQVTLEVVSGYVADLRAFFFNVADANLLASLQVDGTDVTNVEADDNAVTSADPPGEPNINPLGPFDVGVEIGSQGIGADDIQSTTFIISAGDTDLTLDSISLQQVGIRAQSVGDDREGSSKLTDVVPPNGEEDLGSIAGYKYADEDCDGALDPGEDGVSGWSIRLYLDEDGEGDADATELFRTTFTDANGAYLFDDLPEGNYIVVEDTTVSGWISTGPTQHEVSLDEGEDSTGNNFFNQQIADNGGEGGDNDWGSVLNYVSNFELSATSTVINSYESTGFVVHEVYSDVTLDGNIAEANVDVQAFGEDTFTSLDMVVWTQEGEFSSIQAHAYSATGGDLIA